jgi:hypothetical protein
MAGQKYLDEHGLDRFDVSVATPEACCFAKMKSRSAHPTMFLIYQLDRLDFCLDDIFLCLAFLLPPPSPCRL